MSRLARHKQFTIFQQVVDIATILTLFFQLVGLPAFLQPYLPYIGWGVLVAMIFSLVVDFFYKHKTKLTKAELIKETRTLIRNANGTVVLIGGDLSWADDYKDVINEITQDNRKVEVIFPVDIVAGAKRSVKDSFKRRAETLQKAGAKLLCTEKDLGIRCTLIDVDPDHQNEALKLISSKRLQVNSKDHTKTLYRVELLQNSDSDDKMVCNSFYKNYKLIREHCREWEG